MGIRFRRRIPLLPGIKANLSTKGLTSFTVGPRGMTTNVNSQGWRPTLSLIGTGLSYVFKRRKW